MRLGDLEALANKFSGRDFLSANLRRIVEAEPTIDAVPVSQLKEMLSNLEGMCCGGDEGETYTTGYHNGHHNGQVELLRYILQIPDGTSGEREDSDG